MGDVRTWGFQELCEMPFASDVLKDPRKYFVFVNQEVRECQNPEKADVRKKRE